MADLPTPEITHTPIERVYPSGRLVDCTCGHVEEAIWSHRVGARTAYLEHVVSAALLAADWPGMPDVDYREDDE